MELRSTAFDNNCDIPKKFSCDGEKISPPLEFVDENKEAVESYVLIMDDPDAPGGTFTHWIVWNICIDCTNVSENSVPMDGIEGRNSSGSIGYVPPCPPSGTHRYYFTLYALDTELDLEKGATREELESAMDGHVLAESELMGKYSRE